MREIKNDRLTVAFREESEMLHPHHRFETTGVVAQVTLDGKHVFCEPEQRIRERVTCDGIGLCGEYVSHGPAEEALAGEYYPKFGVGLLLQTEDHKAYNMWESHECIDFPVKAEFGEDRAVFVQEPLPCGGYALRLTKTMTLHENTLTEEVFLENVGEKEIRLAEYQHNFVSLDGELIGPGYELEVPFVKNLHDIEGHVTKLGDRTRARVDGVLGEENGIVRWNVSMGEGYTEFNHADADMLDVSEGKNFWELRKNGLSVRETFGFEPNETMIWGVEHCMCVEAYAPARIAPGETAKWSRTWTFEAK